MPKRKKSGEGKDYISNLPDYIIGHILSFLSTTDAVRTSALSKRWKYMWTFVTKLDFCDGESSYEASNERIKQFSNFVSRVLFHINSANIQNLKLYIRGNYEDFINQWLCAVLNKGVKNIHVASFNSGFSNLSCYPLFQSPSLEKLSLRSQMSTQVSFLIKVPTLVSLPSLTVLNLREITFTHYSSNKLKKLTFRLPLLRTYNISNCTWSGVKSLTFEAPLLEEVRMTYSIRQRY